MTDSLTPASPVDNLTFPIDPVHINQGFGANVDYYQSHFGTAGHPGIDFQAAHGQPVYACHDGFAFYVGPDAHGGDGVYLRFQLNDSWYTAIYWHLCAAEDPQFKPLVDKQGRSVVRGELLGYADNSGAPFESSGDHLHFGLAPCDEIGTFVHLPQSIGWCIDPAPFLGPVPPTRLKHNFVVNLSFGQLGVDIYALQSALKLEGIFPQTLAPTGYYGPVTASAVLQFRVKYQIPSSSDPRGHSVGPLTRAKLNELFA